MATADQLRVENFSQSELTDKFTTGSINYNVKTRTYPSDASISADLQNYIGFFINVRGKSKAYSKNKGTAVNITGTDSGPLDKDRIGKTLQDGIEIATIGASVALAQSFYAKNIANLKNASTTVKAVGNIATVGLAAYGGAKLGEEIAKLFEPDKRYRISDAIMLAMQERPSVRYGVEYMATDMGTLTGALMGGASALSMNEMLPEIARKGLLNLGQIPAAAAGMAVGENIDLKGLASASGALTPNPFREQIFQNVDTRTFTFDYKFLPKSEKECNNVREILYAFAYHMHPELSAKGLFYIYPSQFNIQFYHKGTENRWINKISTCVLTDMNVDYGSNAAFSTFELTGAPTEINLKLTFRELEVLTRERIETWHAKPPTSSKK